jgi:hypothetical protein
MDSHPNDCRRFADMVEQIAEKYKGFKNFDGKEYFPIDKFANELAQKFIGAENSSPLALIRGR